MSQLAAAFGAIVLFAQGSTVPAPAVGTARATAGDPKGLCVAPDVGDANGLKSGAKGIVVIDTKSGTVPADSGNIAFGEVDGRPGARVGFNPQPDPPGRNSALGEVEGKAAIGPGTIGSRAIGEVDGKTARARRATEPDGPDRTTPPEVGDRTIPPEVGDRTTRPGTLKGVGSASAPKRGVPAVQCLAPNDSSSG